MKVLELDVASPVDTDKPLSELGLTSLLGIELCSALSVLSGVKLSPALLFDYPTIDALTNYLANVIAPSSDVKGTRAGRVQPLQIPMNSAQLSDEELEMSLIQELENSGY